MKTKLLLSIILLLGMFDTFHAQKLNTFGTEFIFPNIQQRGLNIETGSLPATVTIVDMGNSFTQIINLPADTAIALALLNFTSPNYTRFVQGNLFAQLASTRITSTNPIALRYRSADGAGGGMSSLLPVEELGYDYTISTHHIEHMINLNFHNMLPHMVITATENNTPVTIIPTHNTDNGWLAGSTNVITLNRGQSYPIQGKLCNYFGNTIRPACFPMLTTSLNNFCGTRIYTDSCKKIKVTFYLQGSYIGGGRYVPPSCCSESSIETVLPNEKVGRTYYVVPELHIRQGDLFKIMALENNTHVFIDNSFVKTLNKGEYLDTISKVPIKVTGNKDFHLSQIFMAAGNESVYSPPSARWYDTTDPEFVYPYPIQYRSTFFNFAHKIWQYSTSNPYAHHLTIITETNNIGNFTLDGVTLATSLFQPFAADPAMSYAYFNVTDGFHRLKTSSGSFQALMSRNVTQGSQCYYSAIDTNVYFHNLPAMQDTCVSDTISLYGDTTMAYSYLWSTGATTPSIRVHQAGTYWVHNIKCLDTITDTFNIDSYLYSFTSANICTGGVYNFRGNLLTLPGKYSDTITNPFGCDSIINLNLILKNNPDSSVVSINLCAGDSFVLNNITYTSPGIFYDTLQNIAGCDSAAVTLNITVTQAPTNDIRIDTLCPNDTIYFNGTPISTAGTFYDTLMGNSGCDSIYYELQTTLVSSKSDTIYHTICDDSSYTFNGNSLDSAGKYFLIIPTAQGCDSLVVLYLSVTPTYYYYLDTNFCIDDSIFMVNGTINKEGLTRFNFITNQGCDSIIEVYVTDNCPNKIFVPSAFTPDGDGLNDIFRPTVVDSVSNYELLIFNRWGETLFKSNDVFEGWDGKHQGVMSPNDVFIWKIRYQIGNETQSIIGHVHLSR